MGSEAGDRGGVGWGRGGAAGAGTGAGAEQPQPLCTGRVCAGSLRPGRAQRGVQALRFSDVRGDTDSR